MTSSSNVMIGDLPLSFLFLDFRMRLRSSSSWNFDMKKFPLLILEMLGFINLKHKKHNSLWTWRCLDIFLLQNKNKRTTVVKVVIFTVKNIVHFLKTFYSLSNHQILGILQYGPNQFFSQLQLSCKSLDHRLWNTIRISAVASLFGKTSTIRSHSILTKKKSQQQLLDSTMKKL